MDPPFLIKKLRINPLLLRSLYSYQDPPPPHLLITDFEKKVHYINKTTILHKICSHQFTKSSKVGRL